MDFDHLMFPKILVRPMAYEVYLAAAVCKMRRQGRIGRVHATAAMESASDEHPGPRA